MITTRLNNIELVLYDSIDNMPIINYTMFNKYVLVDSNIGATFEDVDSHIIRIMRFISTDQKLAVQELQNMRQSMHMIVEGINPKLMSFVCFIHKIDGELFTDLTDSGVSDVLKKLSSVKTGALLSLLEKIKKNVNTELSVYFTGLFDNVAEKEAHTLIKQRTTLVLEGIINNINNANTIDEIDGSLLMLSKPRQFSGIDSVEVTYIKQFENICIIIAQVLNLHAKQLTVFEFYTAILRLKDKKHAK